MQANRDLDALDAAVAEQVMGLAHGYADTFCEGIFVSCPVCRPSRYSSDGQAMLAVLARLQELGWRWTLRSQGTWGEERPIAVVSDARKGTPFRIEEAAGATIQEAVARAALLAVVEL